MDQAHILREKFSNVIDPKINEQGLKTKSICITSGKGGVGKTSLSVNICVELAKKNYKILLIDCDFGLANVDIILNISSKNSLSNLLVGEVKIEDVIVDSKFGFDVLPASSGIPDIADLEVEKQKLLIRELARIQSKYDYLIFDTGSGIHRSILRICAASDQIVVVTNPEPTAITDSYSIIKALRSIYKVQIFNLVVMKSNYNKALNIKKLLENVAYNNGVIIELNLLGAIEYDKVVEQGIIKRVPWVKIKKYSECVRSLSRICENLIDPQNQQIEKNSNSFWKKWILTLFRT